MKLVVNGGDGGGESLKQNQLEGVFYQKMKDVL